MKILILLGALLATSALAEEFSVKVNRMEASAVEEDENSTRSATTGSKIKNEAEVEKEAAADWVNDYNSSRPNRSQGDEPGVLKGNARGAASGTVTGRRQHGVAARDAASGMASGKRQHRLDDDSDDDGVKTKARTCGVDDDCDGTVDETARKAKRQDRKTTRD